ncbi:mechanosensitive ion channel family protein [Halobellus salinisoli]|uniref:mechanosensitive ion channel family protein n=1 Tax=Halobellus salinisoli TaxID=3108500 RepID=UPI0030086514
MFSQNTVFTLQIGGAINEALASAVSYLPTVIAALIILIVGYVIGRLLGGLVTRIIRRIGVDRYTEGTAMETVGEEDGVARALGKVVSYYVYFVAILAAADVLDIPQLTQLLSELAAFLPVILGALVVLVIGFIVGRVIGDLVADIVGGFDVGRYLRETPLERLSDSEGEFGRIIGLLVTYYIYLLTLLAVADILAIDALSTLLDTFAGYLPALVGGLLVLLVGIWVAERVGRLVSEMGEGRTVHVASLIVKVLIYYITITIAVATIGFEILVLTNLFTAFVAAFFGALAIALAIGIGLAVGLGGQEYVAENIDGWVASARDVAADDTAGGSGVADTDSPTESAEFEESEEFEEPGESEDSEESQ